MKTIDINRSILIVVILYLIPCYISQAAYCIESRYYSRILWDRFVKDILISGLAVTDKHHGREMMLLFNAETDVNYWCTPLPVMAWPGNWKGRG